MKLTIREVVERYGGRHKSYLQACTDGRLPSSLEWRTDARGIKRKLRVIRVEDVEAYLAVDTSDAMTLEDAAKKIDVKLTSLKNAAYKGLLKTKKTRRRFVDKHGKEVIRPALVVTEEDLEEYVSRRKAREEARRKAQEEARRKDENKRRVPALAANPYREYWERGEVPEHIQPALYLLLKGIESGLPFHEMHQNTLNAAASRVVVVDNWEDAMAMNLAMEVAV